MIENYEVSISENESSGTIEVFFQKEKLFEVQNAFFSMNFEEVAEVIFSCIGLGIQISDFNWKKIINDEIQEIKGNKPHVRIR